MNVISLRWQAQIYYLFRCVALGCVWHNLRYRTYHSGEGQGESHILSSQPIASVGLMDLQQRGTLIKENTKIIRSSILDKL